jgi:hypothetical protein
MPVAKILLVLFLLACLTTLVAQQVIVETADVDGWKVTTKLLPPSAFPKLPLPVRRELDRQHCMIPQTWASRKPENVISGAFKVKGQTDWAVLCSLKGTSRLLVFWKELPSATQIAEKPNAQISQTYDETGILRFSWGIYVATPKTILTALAEDGDNRATAQVYDHDGILDSFVGKASTIRYLRNGKWAELDGSD